jgi:hypothetical protein
MVQRTRQPYEPDARECAILLLAGWPESEPGSGSPRSTLKRLWKRRRLRDECKLG